MSVNFKFSSCLYHKRIERGYTQDQVAEAVKISSRWYQKIEKGETLPGTIIFLRLIKLFDIDVDDFLSEADVNYDCLPKLKNR